jgi:Mg-chelatase subunit ChlD
VKSPITGIYRRSLLFALVLGSAPWVGAAEPSVEILTPRNNERISQNESSVLLRGKVASHTARAAQVDILFLLDISGSTAHYAGVNFPELIDLPPLYFPPAGQQPQVTVPGASYNIDTSADPPRFNLRNSIFAAEIVASRRMLSQLNPQTTRVGVITFSDFARVRLPLTHDFAQARKVLDEVYRSGPHGGTNMVEGIRLGIKELLGLGASENRANSVKTQFLLTDGLPSLPIGEGKRSTPEDTGLAINAASMSGRAGMKIQVFALGREIVDYPYAAAGIARESGGTYIPLLRPADLLVAMESISAVDVHHVQVVNQTTGQKASRTRLGADGFFAAAVPLAQGPNQIEVLVRASDGSTNRANVAVYYQSGTQLAVDLEIFLEKEKKLEVEIERLGKTAEEIQREVEVLRRQNANAGPQSLQR